jgi:hypothetical protein
VFKLWFKTTDAAPSKSHAGQDTSCSICFGGGGGGIAAQVVVHSKGTWIGYLNNELGYLNKELKGTSTTVPQRRDGVYRRGDPYSTEAFVLVPPIATTTTEVYLRCGSYHATTAPSHDGGVRDGS